MQKTLTFTQLWYRRLQNLTAIKPATTRGRAIIRYQEKKLHWKSDPQAVLGVISFFNVLHSMRLWVKLYQQLIITVYYPLMCIHLFVYKCVCVRGEAACTYRRGTPAPSGEASCGSCRFSSSPPPPTSWIRRCLSHSGPPQPPAPPARSREHSQFTLCLLTLVTFTADELFVVLPQPTRLKKNPFISRKLLRHEAPAATTGNVGPRFAHNWPPHVLPGVVCVERYFFVLEGTPLNSALVAARLS